MRGGARRRAGRGRSRVLRFGLEFKFAISQRMVRADVFQKCCHSTQVIVGKQIRGLIQGYYNLPSRFEPRHALVFNVGDFLLDSHVLLYERILFCGVFVCGQLVGEIKVEQLF